MELILASSSPRRQQILTKYNFKFKVIPSNTEEVIDSSLSPEKVSESLAYQKAKSVFDIYRQPTLGADTIVVFNGEILGKPKDRAQSRKMLQSLSGKTHQVITGFAYITKEKEIVSHNVSMVTFNELSKEIIDEYVELGLGLDKAGSYGIQDGYNFVQSVEGSINNVIGLPIEVIEPIIRG